MKRFTTIEHDLVEPVTFLSWGEFYCIHQPSSLCFRGNKKGTILTDPGGVTCLHCVLCCSLKEKGCKRSLKCVDGKALQWSSDYTLLFETVT